MRSPRRKEPHHRVGGCWSLSCVAAVRRPSEPGMAEAPTRPSLNLQPVAAAAIAGDPPGASAAAPCVRFCRAAQPLLKCRVAFLGERRLVGRHVNSEHPPPVPQPGFLPDMARNAESMSGARHVRSPNGRRLPQIADKQHALDGRHRSACRKTNRERQVGQSSELMALGSRQAGQKATLLPWPQTAGTPWIFSSGSCSPRSFVRATDQLVALGHRMNAGAPGDIIGILLQSCSSRMPVGTSPPASDRARKGSSRN